MWRWIGGYVAIAVSLTGVAVAGPVAPNEVCIYEHVDFVGTSRCFSLEPGMRHKLVPKLGGMNDRASSVHVGEDVSVVLYEHANFGGLSHRHDINRRDLGASGTGLKIGLQDRDAEKKDEVWPDFNDLVSSLIIVPKTMRVSGVELRRSLMGGMGSTENAFYPLPERLNESEARYPLLGWMNDKANYLNLYGDVEITLYEHANFDGKPLKLPGVGDEKEHFILSKYQFDERASSLVVRWKGPQQHLAAEQVKVPQPSAPPPRDSFLINTGGTTHRAPASMEPQTAKVLQTDSMLEMDTNRPGQDYRKFDLDVPEPKRCQRTCQDDPKCMAWTFARPGVQGPKARCWLKSGVPLPKPSSCCISGVKGESGGEASPGQVPVVEEPPMATRPITLEPDTDRPGSNLKGFDLDTADRMQCAEACLENGQCRAYTYVKPGVQGPNARCWLKSGVPPPKPSPCCISGVKTQ